MSIVKNLPATFANRDIEGMCRRRYDALVIGGGINGAGIARDLALRGLRVALVEKGDFASGTSSASTKLIHGGVRYLEHLDFHLVFESCRERSILQKIAPHLVRPLPFFIPVYRDDPRSLLTIRAGMALYDLLALLRNTRHHSILNPAEAVRREPALQQEGLKGVALYWDCRMDDARLCLENVLAAREAGAETRNYLQVTGLLASGGLTRGARLRDMENGEEVEIEARVVVNATGPWLDEVCALDGDEEKKLRPTRGTHILVPRINCGEEALYLTAGRDDRLFFVIPRGPLSLIGTTDVDFRGGADEVGPTEEDVGYLLSETARHLRREPPKRSEVVASFAGLRPLLSDSSAKASGVSREHRIFESGSGLISVGGGKYTTYRAVADEVARRVCRRLGKSPGRCLTHRLPLPGGATGRFETYLRRRTPVLAERCGLPETTVESLILRYGSRIDQLLALADAEPELLQPIAEKSTLLAVEAAYAIEVEMARTPEDILRRRTALALGAGRGVAELENVSTLLGRRLRAPADRCQQWQSAYRARYSTP